MGTTAVAQLELFDAGEVPGGTTPGATRVEMPPLPHADLPKPEPETSPNRRELAQSLATALSTHTGARVRLAVTDNRSTMLSFKKRPGELVFRVHHVFLAAPPNVVSAIAEYAVSGRRGAGLLIDDYVESRRVVIRTARRAGEQLEAVGQVHNLNQMFHRLNMQHFAGSVRARIGWTKSAAKRNRRSIRLGVYDHGLKEIRIHRLLDSEAVPVFFVEYIVYHEMLHELFPSRDGAARRVHHPPAFRARERQFPQYEQAREWEQLHLSALLMRRRPRRTRQ